MNSSTNKQKIINDPVHGFIRIEHPLIFDLIEHPYFQRLRRISQNGLTHLVYPGAIHSRFHHALGCLHLMQLSLNTLKSKGFRISDDEYLAACVAILLHDIGHGPFSHALESVLLPNLHHEELSLEIMKLLNAEFNGQLDLAIAMFTNSYERKFFKQLISSQMDVDRLDYIKRDSFFTGVVEGSINPERIITMFTLADDELVFEEKGIYSIEKFLVSRAFMYWQVYFHKTSVCAELILIKILERAKLLFQENALKNLPEQYRFIFEQNQKEEKLLEKFVQLDDSDIWSLIKSWAYHEDEVLQYLSKQIVNRRLPRAKILPNLPPKYLVENIENEIVNTFGEKKLPYLFSIQKLDVTPYEEHQPLKIITKKGIVQEISGNNMSFLSLHLQRKISRFHIYFPREVDVTI